MGSLKAQALILISKFKRNVFEAFNDAGLGSSLGRCSDGEVCFGIGSLCPDGSMLVLMDSQGLVLMGHFV